VENEKSFLQGFIKALEAEDLDPKNNPGPTLTPLGGWRPLPGPLQPPWGWRWRKSRPGGLYIHGYPYGLVPSEDP
jgi:hypothetical protein